MKCLFVYANIIFNQMKGFVNMCWEDVNNFLAIIGLLSLLMTIIRVIWTFVHGSEWIDNIIIEEYPLEKNFDEEKGFYPQFYPTHPEHIESEYATQNLFSPQSTIIRNAIIKEVDFYKYRWRTSNYKYKKIHKIKEITPSSPLCLVIERSETIPRYKIEWRTEYGGKAEYYFSDNLRNGDNMLKGIRYHFGVIAKIRKILNLK